MEYITQTQLNEKVKTFMDRRVETLESLLQFNFPGSSVLLPLETRDGNLIEAGFCNGYNSIKNLVALSVQAGCIAKCNFCEYGAEGLQRDLTSTEMLDQIAIVLNAAESNGRDLFSRPLKATFVNGGDPLSNDEFPKSFSVMKDELPLNNKVSTLFPNSGKTWRIYEEMIGVVKDYPNISQFQISLNSTDEEYRQSLAAIPLADFSRIREAGELWAEQVPDARKVNLTFTLNAETPVDPYKIKDVLPPELFAIRLRDYVPTHTGDSNNIATANTLMIGTVMDKFQDCGYQFVPGFSGCLEREFQISPGELRRIYNTMKFGGEK